MKATILITGAGGAATPHLIERLQGQGFRVIAVDMDRHAVGLFVADKGYVIPAGSSEDFLPALRDICAGEQVSAVVPLVDEELDAACDLESLQRHSPQGLKECPRSLGSNRAHCCHVCCKLDNFYYVP